MLVLLVSSVSAVVEFPGSATERSTLAYPRWKVFMDESDNENLWAIVAGDDENWYYSMDGGLSWNGGFDVHGSSSVMLDQHVSFDGDSDGLYYIYPTYYADEGNGGIFINKVDYPGTSVGDIGTPIQLFPVDGNKRRSNIQVTDNYVWAFIRDESSNDNVLYRRYDKNLNPVDAGWSYVHQTDSVVRIGSTQYQGNPIVVVHDTNDRNVGQAKIEYFIWNPGTSSFEQRSNSAAWRYGDFGCVVSTSSDRTREYSAVVAGDILHVAWSCDIDNVKHAWLDLSVPGASWNYNDLINGYSGGGSSWYFTPTLTSHGDDVYVFYAIGGDIDSHTSSAGTNEIYYNKWDSVSGWNWAHNPNQNYLSWDVGRDFNTNSLMNVNLGSDYIPVIWTHKTSSYTYKVWSERVPIVPSNPCNNDGFCDVAGGETCSNCVNDCDGEQADCSAGFICDFGECIELVPTCLDGTPTNTCSNSFDYGKPWFCNKNNELVRDCSRCGCNVEKPVCDSRTGICGVKILQEDFPRDIRSPQRSAGQSIWFTIYNFLKELIF